MTDTPERIYTNKTGTAIITPPAIPLHPTDIEWVPAANLAEMTRRRDAWQAKAEGYDAVRLALREKVGAPWPPNMSRLLWAGIAADEKNRAETAEAERDEVRAALVTARQEALEEAAKVASSGTSWSELYSIGRNDAANAIRALATQPQETDNASQEE